MSNLELYRYVWVISIADPAADVMKDDVVAGVYQSRETAKVQLDKLMNNEDRDDDVRYFIEQVPMRLDIMALETVV
jgi:hypothetical protein